MTGDTEKLWYLLRKLSELEYEAHRGGTTPTARNRRIRLILSDNKLQELLGEYREYLSTLG